jgi:putative phage-type endonuclease
MEILDYLPKYVHKIEYTNEDEWLEERKKGIGGSDVSVVLGLNKYKSKLQLYKEKVEDFKEDMSNNVFVKKGKDLESFIRENYVAPYFKDKGYTVLHPEVILVNEAFPNLRANLDGLAVPDSGDSTQNIVVEIKWVSEYSEDNWDNDDYFGIPVNYYAQVQEYMLVTSADKAVVCALFDSDWTVKYYEIPFSYDFCEKMVHEVNTFMDTNVMFKIPPSVNCALDKNFILDSLNNTKNAILPLEEDDSMTELIIRYKEYKSNIKTLEKICNDTLSELTEKYLKGLVPSSPLHSIRMTVCKSTKFDTNRFKEEHPELYKEYLTTSEYTRTTIK